MSYPGMEGRGVVVGLCGSIAAYKACHVISALRQNGAQVRVVATENALQFVGGATLRGLSGHNVACAMFSEYSENEMEHISLAEFGEVIVVVGATANVMAKAAAGICDDLLTTLLCAAQGRIILAPAMNWRMWENPMTSRNVEALKRTGYTFVGPERGHLACGEDAFGRLAALEDILDAIDQGLGPSDSKLAGTSVLITAGPTREALDPVRFISNRSSGKMGFELAREAMSRGAEVTIVAGPTSTRPPWNARVVDVETTQEMFDAVREHCEGADIVIGAAAPTDFRPAKTEEQKIKKEGAEALSVDLEQSPDILSSIGQDKRGRVHVGFAAETEKLQEHAQSKLQAKNLDLIVANDVSASDRGFASDWNEVTIYGSDGSERAVPKCTKRDVAICVLDEIEAAL